MRLAWIICVPVFFWLLSSGATAETTPKTLVDLTSPASVQRVQPTSRQVVVARDGGVGVTISPGAENYPGIAIKPADGKPWDLSEWGDVRAAVTNTGKTPVNISLRVDNEGPWQQGPWNTESITLKPGESGEIKVIFGYAYGHKPSYALKSTAIIRLNLFATKSNQEQSFRIESITAAGHAGEKPPVDPGSIRVEPVAGYLVGTGISPEGLTHELSIDGGKSTETPAANDEKFDIPADQKSPSSIEIKPKVGRWDLRLALEARVTIRNTGTTPISPAVRLESDGGPTDAVAVTAPIAPGTEAEVLIPFAPAIVWQGIPNSGNRTSWEGRKNTGTKFTSDAVSSVKIMLPSSAAGQSLLVKSVRVYAPPAQVPDWLGQRPPVAGDWIKTFDDEFDGREIDSTKWNAVGKNWYDHQSRFVKENVIVADGVAKLHFEKRPGRWASEADGKQTEYATGFLDTYDKWTQRYGYFEARMKLPRSPGLWPAFWMMPNRGAAFHGDRGSTADGGMEFDIMEHLTRWGPYRYNIAMHWDGYGKEHKQTGTTTIYVQPDTDGYITSGLLWTPGSAIYYCNGKEVLRWEDPRISSVPADLMFTFPMGGWDNNALDDSKLPADFTIDYIRCWQRKDLQADDNAGRPAKEKP